MHFVRWVFGLTSTRISYFVLPPGGGTANTVAARVTRNTAAARVVRATDAVLVVNV